MALASTHHQHTPAAKFQIPGMTGDDCELKIIQEPKLARVAIGKEKDRKPCDPPPIVQLTVSEHFDPNQSYLHSPYFFVFAVVVNPDGTPAGEKPGTLISGAAASSLHRLKIPKNNNNNKNDEGAFFVFADLSIRIEGTFRLQFSLFEMHGSDVSFKKTVLSEPFVVYGTKNFPGMEESTWLTRSFSDQGLRLRLRKEPRQLQRRNGPGDNTYIPKHYNKPNKRKTSDTETRAVDQRETLADSSIRVVERQSHYRGSNPSPTQIQVSPAASLLSLQASPAASVLSYGQRPSLERSQTHTSAVFNNYSMEPPAKRLRAASDHDQPQDFRPHSFSPGFSQSPFDNYSQAPYQQSMFANSYNQSPAPSIPQRSLSNTATVFGMEQHPQYNIPNVHSPPSMVHASTPLQPRDNSFGSFNLGYPPQPNPLHIGPSSNIGLLQ